MAETVESQNVLRVVSPEGETGTIPASQLKQAEAEGFRELSLADSIASARHAAAGGLVGGATAFAAGALRGASGGLSDLAITESFGDDSGLAAEALTQAEEQHGGLSMVGEGIGFLAPTPIGKAGGIAAGLAERGAARLGSAAARTAASGAARFGTEMALYGAGAEVSEAALGDAELNADKILAGAGSGFLGGVLLGGLGGAAVGAARGGITSYAERRAARDAAEKIAGMPDGAFEGMGGAAAVREVTEDVSRLESKAAKLTDEEFAVAAEAGQATGERFSSSMADGVASATERTASKGAVEGTLSQDRGALDKVFRTISNGNQEKYEAMRAVWAERTGQVLRHEDALDKSAREIAADLTEAMRGERTMQMGSQGVAKAEQMARLVPAEGKAAVRDGARAAVDELQRFKSTWEAMPNKAGMGRSLDMLGEHLERLDVLLQESKPSNRDVFLLLDDVKRNMGRVAKYGETALRATQDEALAAGEANGLYTKLRGFLEDEALFGKAAAAQKEINAATHEGLKLHREFGDGFTRRFGSEEGYASFEADAGKVRTHLVEILKPGQDFNRRSLQAYVDTLEKRIDAVTKHYEFGAAEQAEFQSAKGALARLRKALPKAKADAELISSVKKLMATEKAGNLGGGFGFVQALLTQPLTMIASLGEIKAKLTSTSESISKRISRFSERRSASEGSRSSYARSEAGAYGRRAESESRSSGHTTMSRKETAKVAEAMAGSGTSDAPQRLAPLLRLVGDHAPATAGFVALGGARALAYLAQNAPRAANDPNTLTPFADKPRYSTADLDAYAQRIRGVTDPLSILDDVSTGNLTPESVDAVRTCYPRLFQEIQVQVASEVAKRKTPLPWKQQRALAVLLGVPTDHTLTPEFIARMQADVARLAAQAPDAQPRPGRRVERAIDAEQMMTQAEQLAS